MDIDQLVDTAESEVFLYESGWLDSVGQRELDVIHSKFKAHFEECLEKLKVRLGEPTFTKESNRELANELYSEATRLAGWKKGDGFLLLAYGQHDCETPIFVSFGFRDQQAQVGLIEINPKGAPIERWALRCSAQPALVSPVSVFHAAVSCLQYEESSLLVLPEDFELISFFESEPLLATPDTPWCYNKLRFEARRDKDIVVCELEPAFSEMKIYWQQDGVPRVSFKLNRLESLTIHIANGDEHMIVSGLGKNPATLLRLWLKPYVAVEIGCWYEIP